VPNHVLQTAIIPSNNGFVINVETWESYKISLEFMVFLYFADFQNSQLRQFDIYLNNEVFYQYSPKYLTTSSVQNSGWYKSKDNKYNITLECTNISMLPPMINAYEIYNSIPHDTPRTSSEDRELSLSLPLSHYICLPSRFIECY
jgi:hypothetical protein